MTDAISRSAVHIAINSQIFDTEYPSELDELERLIDEIPALDVVPVVRCERCALHGHCTVEDMFILAGFTDGYCRAGKRLSNAVSGARMDGEADG